jgi:hypothetical protein
MTALAPVALFAMVVAMAVVANRRLGWRLDPPRQGVSEADARWLDELAVLRLEQRHPIC